MIPCFFPVCKCSEKKMKKAIHSTFWQQCSDALPHKIMNGIMRLHYFSARLIGHTAGLEAISRG
jgi:hypothetical protein